MLRRLSARQLAPLGVAGFRLLFLSTLVSSIGTLLAAIALAIDVKDRTNSGLWVGAVLIVEFLPTIVVGLTLGPLLDRLERRSLMVGADLVRAAVFGTLPFVSSAAGIVALALAAGLATGFFRPAVYAGVPNLVPEDQLPEANALLQTVENVSWAVGPVLGGLLTATAGPHTAYWINAVSFLVSAVLVVRISKRLLQSQTALTRGHWRDLADGFVAVMRSRPLLAVLTAWGIASIGVGAISLSEVFLAKDTLHAGDFGYGLLYGGIGTGLVIGSWWSSAVVDRLGIARAYAGALVVMALGFGLGSISPDIWATAACCLLGGIGDGIAIVCNALLVQRGAADRIRGRALTLVMSVTYVLNGAGTVVAGAVLHLTGPRWVWGGGALSFVVGAVAAYALARDDTVPVESISTI
ncbi:MAG TPA: MFS transporter [Gaiellaceae bacterium]|nr:MFS transporter [Gaiellaceae bacterium]